MKRISEIDRDYLRRCKATTIEQRLDWLVAAHELMREGQKNLAGRKRMKQLRAS